MSVILATLCYVDNGESYLLLHRNKKEKDIHKGKWIGVGGKTLSGESAIECVIREVKEETGLAIEQPTLRGTIRFPLFDGLNDWVVSVFVAKQFSGTLVKACSEGTLEWVPYQYIHTKPTWQGDNIFLQWLLENKPFFEAEFTYNKDGTLDNWSVAFNESVDRA